MQSESDNQTLCPEIIPFLDPDSRTYSYVVIDPASSSCAVVDPVLDFDYASGRTATDGADAIIDSIKTRDLTLEWLIETHVHADHLSAAPYIRGTLGGRIGIGNKIDRVQRTFAELFNEGSGFLTDGSQFDHLFADGESYAIGSLRGQAICTPGHTPACMTHIIGDAAFVGDTIFMPDGGTARADFPGGDAAELYDSIQKILSLPDDTRIFVCHDYSPGGRQPACETSVAKQKAENIHVGGSASRESFVTLRRERDATLDMPRLIIPSVQVNMRAGNIPLDPDGRKMLKVPLDTF